MDWRNRLGLYGAYFLGVSGIGFTLPYLPVYLGDQQLSDAAIGVVSTLAALAGLVQFPLGLLSDRLGRRKPILVGALGVLAVATALLPWHWGPVVLALLVILFAENGACRATVESLAGAEAAHLAAPSEVGAALGALRFWKPVGIIVVAFGGGWLAEAWGIEAILGPLTVVQVLAVGMALLIHERRADHGPALPKPATLPSHAEHGLGLRDGALWLFMVAMLLFHFANAPGGVYLGLFLERDLAASRRFLSYAFVISMSAWMLVVRPAGAWADRLGRRPLLIAGWSAASVRLLLIALAQTPAQVLAIQVLDGVAQGLFAVVAAAWVTDRLADPRRVGEAQVLVGSALVAGSAAGPLVCSLLIGSLGYRALFAVLAGVAALATAVVVLGIPETVRTQRFAAAPATSDLSVTS